MTWDEVVCAASCKTSIGYVVTRLFKMIKWLYYLNINYKILIFNIINIYKLLIILLYNNLNYY
jgi:hypothetical protein